MGGWIGGMGWGGEEAFMTCWRGKQSGTRKKSMAKKWCYQPGQFSVNHQSRLAAVQANEETITLKWAEKPSTSWNQSCKVFEDDVCVVHCHSLRRWWCSEIQSTVGIRGPVDMRKRARKARGTSGFSFLGHYCRVEPTDLGFIWLFGMLPTSFIKFKQIIK